MAGHYWHLPLPHSGSVLVTKFTAIRHRQIEFRNPKRRLTCADMWWTQLLGDDDGEDNRGDDRWRWNDLLSFISRDAAAEVRAVITSEPVSSSSSASAAAAPASSASVAAAGKDSSRSSFVLPSRRTHVSSAVLLLSQRSQCDNYNPKSHKYVCITTYQPDTKSNHDPNPNPNSTSKQHEIVNIKQNSHTSYVSGEIYTTQYCCTICTTSGCNCHTCVTTKLMSESSLTMPQSTQFDSFWRRTTSPEASNTTDCQIYALCKCMRARDVATNDLRPIISPPSIHRVPLCSKALHGTQSSIADVWNLKGESVGRQAMVHST